MKIGSYGHVAEKSRSGKGASKIYYNPRCSKCREALDMLRAESIDPEVVEYLDVPLKKEALLEILQLLKGEPGQIIRTKEKVFSELNVDLKDPESVIAAILKHPVLLERPIFIHNGRAIIGRPSEKVLELLS